MKKTIAFAVLVVLILVAWNDKKTLPPSGNSILESEISSSAYRDTVSSEKAKRMFNKFKSNFKRGQTIISKFDREELIGILQGMNTTDSVIFFVAMHEDNNPRIKDKGVVLMQVPVPVSSERSTSKASVVNSYTFLNRFFYLSGSVCPPPSDCVIQ